MSEDTRALAIVMASTARVSGWLGDRERQTSGGALSVRNKSVAARGGGGAENDGVLVLQIDHWHLGAYQRYHEIPRYCLRRLRD